MSLAAETEKLVAQLIKAEYENAYEQFTRGICRF